MDKRFKQAEKEAKLACSLTIVYLLMWVATAYLLGSAPGILGLPRWFEASCLFLPVAFILICWLVVTYQFQDMPLTPSEK